MASKLVALGGAALALLMVASFSIPADAHRRGGAHHSGGHRMGGHHFGDHHFGGMRHHHHAGRHFHFRHAHHFHHRRMHRHAFVGVPFAYGAYYYGDGCYWLRRRALYTGSPYWWNRYYACINGYIY